MCAIRRGATDTLALIFVAKGNPGRKGAWPRQRLHLLNNCFPRVISQKPRAFG
jgi:hypothetical protein